MYRTLYGIRGVILGQNEEALLFESLRLELRRGSLILAVLASLRREQYGYSLRVALGEAGVEMEESTLYPLLRRLESQGLLDSEWREEERRKKRFYRLSPRGEAMLARLAAEWRALSASLEKML
ncbi:MAG: helix-turn-helix transcriptional regulator [Candidatus Brevundimonas colombiensis]|uniref:Helix-turn-helix transcriptional regulator n=1 Tax=Candidatus Brevundimonas colombiensis TaxID=3121376 RepID=A0AAJ5WXT3_9CAUL|nr:helix-turn-helix transcriptional regulator [Brevundimonas sp.]WEK38532.1 MAG: helix-turn-helix transcriptional regulator [Brevundimonas sp.]